MQNFSERIISDFSNRKIVFIDWLYVHAGYGSKLNKNKNFLDSSIFMPYGIKLKIFPPIIEKEPTIKHEYPPEQGYIAGYSTVINDKGLLKLYYEVFHQKNPKKWSDHDSFLLYAESKDGKVWKRPSLGIIEFKGNKNNNILCTPETNPLGVGVHGSNVFIDENPEAKPEEKYKMNYCGPKGMTYGAYSEDGIHWKFHTKKIADTHADSQNIIYWDKKRRKYIGYFRTWYKDRRGIVRAESEDFWNWPPFENFDLIYLSDPNLDVDCDYYTNGFHIWPGTEKSQDTCIMFPTIYHRNGDYLVIEFYTSRTGRQWFRHSSNPIVTPNYRNIFPKGAVYFGKGIWNTNSTISNTQNLQKMNLEETKEWNIFVAIYERNHNDHFPVGNYGGLYRAKFRPDGFMGITAENIGEFWTCKFFTKSPYILLNAITAPQGWIKIGLVDSLRNCEIEEFTIDNCIPFNGDIFFKPIQWKSEDGSIQKNIEYFDDVMLRLHVKMKMATIFAFKFSD
ncbi:MAG: hypothetical protein ACTSRZ_10885 [Promethearchaeota archaeon]